MYKILLAAIIVSLSINIGFSQAPQKFKYQAVVRNNQGNILQNQIVSVRVAIVQNNPSGFEVYSETHKPTTNQFGLINLVIGDGTVLSGDMAGIDWSSDEYFLKIGIDITGGSTYVLLGTSQLLSVPYALYAEKAGNVNNTDTSATNEIQDLDLNQDNVLTITNKDIPTPIDLSVFMDNTDSQQLSISGDTLFISNGNQVVINDDVIDADNNPTNEIQILSFNQDTLYLSNGGFIYLGNYDNQQAISALISKMVTDSAFMHNQLDDTKNDLKILENKHATDSALLAGQLTTNALNINQNANKIIQDSTFLKGLIDNNTSLSATNLQSFLYIRAKQTSDSAYFDGKISSNTNNINSLLSGVTNNTSSINNLRYKQTSDSTVLHNLISTNTTSISNHISADGDLDSLNEIQSLSYSNDILTIANSNQVTLDIDRNDRDSTNEIQSLNFVNDTLSLTNSNHVLIDVDRNDRDSLNEIQTLSISNDTLFLSSGNYIVLSKYDNSPLIDTLLNRYISDSINKAKIIDSIRYDINVLDSFDGFIGEVRMFAISLNGAVTIQKLQSMGWAICNGTTSSSQGISNSLITLTPNLSNRFIRMSADSSSGETGGSDIHNHQWAENGGKRMQISLPQRNDPVDIAYSYDSDGVKSTILEPNNSLVSGNHWTANESSLPSYYELVFFIKVK